MRSNRTLAALAILIPAAALAGCLGDTDLPEGPFTAREQVGNLDDLELADDTVEDAMKPPVGSFQLIAAYAVEARPLDEARFPDLNTSYLSALVDREDRSLGDGVAPSWAYLYWSPDTEHWYDVRQKIGSREYGVRAGTTASPIQPVFQGLEKGLPIEGGWMDSDDAAAWATVLEPDWIPAGAQGSVVMVLNHPEHLENPYWGLAYWPLEGGPSVVLMDAITGDPLTKQEVFGYREAVLQMDFVRLTPVGNEDVTFEFEAGYTSMQLRVEPESMANPAAHVHAWLYDPDGNEVAIDDTSWPEAITARIQHPAPGTWRLMLGSFSDMDAAHMYDEVHVSWCSDGGHPDPLGVAPAAGACL